MHDIEALDSLLEKVRAGGDLFPATEADCAFPTGQNGTRQLAKAHLAYMGSLDAAKALHEAVLPGWGWELHDNGACTVFDHEESFLYVVGNSDTPARAMLIAVLEGLKAKMQQEVV